MNDHNTYLRQPRTLIFFTRCCPLSPLALLLMMALAFAGCSQRSTTAHVPTNSSSAPPSAQAPANPQPAGVNPPNSAASAKPSSPGSNVPPISNGHTEVGMASWYGVPYHGRRASNGEIYDMYKMTAAHRTLPFNTMVRVTNLANGEHVDVRIIDRGPFVEDRIIDLSLVAARAIDMVSSGTARVRVEVISSAPIPALGVFAVQVGAFSDRANAERLRDQLAATYQPASIQEFTGPDGKLFRVRVGNAPNESAARILAAKVQTDSGLFTFVVRMDDSPSTLAPGGDQQR
jgi:rare lipoprotein A